MTRAPSPCEPTSVVSGTSFPGSNTRAPSTKPTRAFRVGVGEESTNHLSSPQWVIRSQIVPSSMWQLS